jgi:sugar phosphate isomerase/epimerase
MAYKPYVPNYASLSYTGGSDYSEFSTGYKMQANIIGAPTNPQTANQIAEVTARLNEGMKAVEVGALSPEIFETIPKQQFKEIRQLAKLTGSEMTVHGPMIDPSGFQKEGWSEFQRQEAERQLTDVMKRSAELGDKNVVVTIHASGIPAWEWQKNLPKEEQGKAMMVAVNQETGQLIPVKREEKLYPEVVGARLLTGERVRGKVYTPEHELDTVNLSEWHNTISNLAHFKKEGDEILSAVLPRAMATEEALAKGELAEKDLMTPEGREGIEAMSRVKSADLYFDDVQSRFIGAFDKAYKYGDESVKKNLNEIAVQWAKDFRKIQELEYKERKPMAATELKAKALGNAITHFNQAVIEIPSRTEGGKIPQLYAPVEQFAVKHASETIGNVAFKAYRDLGEKAPIIALENFFPEMAFSRADQLRKLVDESKKKFIKQAVEKENLSREEAKRVADKLIGVTWDIGHINLLRKGGYGEKEIVEETRKIAPLVKKAHITDNFGYNDTHLPPGMGNVPVKKMMEQLEKQGFSGKAIMEAGGFVQQFKVSPHPYVLEALGSPIYGEPSPTWAGARGVHGGYFSGYGPFLPEQHFSMYGAGFSSLPTELGGQIPGKQSRLAGTPVD